MVGLGAMRELRTCPVTGVVVLLNDAWPDLPAPLLSLPEVCWACGKPGPILGVGRGVVAVPHPVPALGVEGDVRARRDGPGIRREAVGAHELVFGAHDPPGVDAGDVAALELAAERVADLRRDRRLRGFSVFRRSAAGLHAQWQILATPEDRLPGEAAGWRDAELSAGIRVIAEGGGAVAIAAWAPRVPFEVWVVPRAGAADFPFGLVGVAPLAARIRSRIERWLGGAAVDSVVEFGSPWRLVLRPLVHSQLPTPIAGLSGHGVFPELAAEQLRRQPET